MLCFSAAFSTADHNILTKWFMKVVSLRVSWTGSLPISCGCEFLCVAMSLHVATAALSCGVCVLFWVVYYFPWIRSTQGILLANLKSIMYYCHADDIQLYVSLFGRTGWLTITLNAVRELSIDFGFICLKTVLPKQGEGSTL